MLIRTIGLLFLIQMSLSACSTPSVQGRIAHANQLAVKAGFKRRVMPTAPFQVVAFQKIIAQRASSPLHIYLEGDGFSWATRYRPSSNPTPKNPVGLKLALADPHQNVIYLSRPCQYHLTAQESACGIKDWTQARYSEQITSSLNTVVETLLAEFGSKHVELIGYSGGGALALLIAARRNDIAAVRTVAGNVATHYFTQKHGVSALTGSLDPVDNTEILSGIPQYHYIGGDDTSIPADIFHYYHSTLTSPNCVRHKILSGVSHATGWIDLWPELIREPLCLDR